MNFHLEKKWRHFKNWKQIAFVFSCMTYLWEDFSERDNTGFLRERGLGWQGKEVGGGLATAYSILHNLILNHEKVLLA